MESCIVAQQIILVMVLFSWLFAFHESFSVGLDYLKRKKNKQTKPTEEKVENVSEFGTS